MFKATSVDLYKRIQDSVRNPILDPISNAERRVGKLVHVIRYELSYLKHIIFVCAHRRREEDVLCIVQHLHQILDTVRYRFNTFRPDPVAPYSDIRSILPPKDGRELLIASDLQEGTQTRREVLPTAEVGRGSRRWGTQGGGG